MSTPAEIENLRPVFQRILQTHQLSPKDLKNDLCHISVSDKGAFQCANCHRSWSSMFSWINLHLRDLEITYRWKMKCKQCYLDCIPKFTVPQLERMFEKAVKFYKGDPSPAAMDYGTRRRRTARPDPHRPDLCEMCHWGLDHCWYRQFYPA